jgi:hypothetical protein
VPQAHGDGEKSRLYLLDDCAFSRRPGTLSLLIANDATP